MTIPQMLVAGSAGAAFVMWSAQWMRARRNRTETGRIVNSAFRIGALLEFVAFAIVAGSPTIAVAEWLQWTGVVAAAVCAAFGIAAGFHLGRNFRVQAVVTAEHQLIKTGPYSIVRHPIYASLAGLLLGYALVSGRVTGLALALPVFVLGTEIRVRAEDKILRGRFGGEFDAYAARVAAYLPLLR